MGDVVSLDRARSVQERAPGGNRKGTRRQFGNVRRLPSKRWQASYTGPDGARHNGPVTFDTKGDAEAWLAMRHAEITEHRWRPAPPTVDLTTLAVYADRWLDGSRRRLKPRTISEYRRILDDKIIPALGETPLTALTAADVRAWYAGLDPAAKTARAHAYGLLHTICAAAIDEERIGLNPCRIAGAGTTRRARKIRPATVAELEAIAAAMPPKYRLAVHLASWCALRYGELAELRRRDLDVDAGILHVTRAVTWPEGTPVVGTPKSDAGTRDVYVPPHVVPLIRDHLATHVRRARDALIFPNANGEHLHHGSLYKVYKPARKAAGRPDLRWHDLRHTGAVFAAQSGATLAEQMARLGHSTVAAAMVYQHATDTRNAEIARRLSEMAERS